MLSYFILIIIAGSKYKCDSLMEDKKYLQVPIQSVTIGKDQYRKVIYKRSKKIENLNRVVNVRQIISKLCFKQSLFNDLVLAESLTHNNLHVACFLLLLCHTYACTFVTGVCKLKRFIDVANISIRTSRFFSLFVTKKKPKQSIIYDFVAVTLARITFQSDIFIFPVLNFFFVKQNLNQ